MFERSWAYFNKHKLLQIKLSCFKGPFYKNFCLSILYSEIINKYAENRKKFFELMDDKQVVEDLLIDGAKKARVQAQKVLKRVRANVGY